jgi:hypothetical protein
MDREKWVDDMAVSYEVSREDLFSDGGCTIAVPLEHLTSRRAKVSGQGTYELVKQPSPAPTNHSWLRRTPGKEARQGELLERIFGLPQHLFNNRQLRFLVACQNVANTKLRAKLGSPESDGTLPHGAHVRKVSSAVRSLLEV